MDEVPDLDHFRPGNFDFPVDLGRRSSVDGRRGAREAKNRK
jgi:hypothetical protein